MIHYGVKHSKTLFKKDLDWKIIQDVYLVPHVRRINENKKSIVVTVSSRTSVYSQYKQVPREEYQQLIRQGSQVKVILTLCGWTFDSNGITRFSLKFTAHQVLVYDHKN